MENLKLELLDRVGCLGGECPHIYRTNRKTFVVQGSTFEDRTGIKLGPSESAVEIPESLLIGLVDRLRKLTGD